jgi:N-acetyl-gamma-glutamyl-phosphate reductase
LTAITSRKEAGMPVAEMFPSLRGRVSLAFSTPEEAPLKSCDVVFFATPNGVAMQQTRELLDAGVKVIDLAADFRIQDRRMVEVVWHGTCLPGSGGRGGVWLAGNQS